MRRRLVAGLLAARVAAAAQAAEPAGPDPRLAGRWEGLDGIGRCSGFVFEKGGNVIAFVSRGKVVIPDAKKAARMHYATDEVSGLARMDLILADAAGRELQRLFAIYRFPPGTSSRSAPTTTRTGRPAEDPTRATSVLAPDLRQPGAGLPHRGAQAEACP